MKKIYFFFFFFCVFFFFFFFLFKLIHHQELEVGCYKIPTRLFHRKLWKYRKSSFLHAFVVSKTPLGAKNTVTTSENV